MYIGRISAPQLRLAPFRSRLTFVFIQGCDTCRQTGSRTLLQSDIAQSAAGLCACRAGAGSVRCVRRFVGGLSGGGRLATSARLVRFRGGVGFSSGAAWRSAFEHTKARRPAARCASSGVGRVRRSAAVLLPGRLSFTASGGRRAAAWRRASVVFQLSPGRASAGLHNRPGARRPVVCSAVAGCRRRAVWQFYGLACKTGGRFFRGFIGRRSSASAAVSY